jgi:hypothetical protein
MSRRPQRYRAHPNIATDAVKLITDHPGITYRGIQRKLPYRVAVEQIQRALQADIALREIKVWRRPTGHHLFRASIPKREWRLLALTVDPDVWILEQLRRAGRPLSRAELESLAHAQNYTKWTKAASRTWNEHLKDLKQDEVIRQVTKDGHVGGQTRGAHYVLTEEGKLCIESQSFRWKCRKLLAEIEAASRGQSTPKQ